MVEGERPLPHCPYSESGLNSGKSVSRKPATRSPITCPESVLNRLTLTANESSATVQKLSGSYVAVAAIGFQRDILFQKPCRTYSKTVKCASS
jgi:hypothetical protein